ncbi:MAG: nickel pincer cofactor biosynthesis protein LarC [Desulfovermiculus sp.]
MHLYLQCPTGISGDMFLAAMADLGLDLKPLADTLTQAGAEVRIDVYPARCCGLQGTRVEVVSLENVPPLRTLEQICPLVKATAFSSRVRARAVQAFERLAQVEAEVHGVPVSAVHFHEVGALDTVVDILGCFWALEALGVDRVTCSELPWFQGSVDCAHGRLPLPAPATVSLLQGKPVFPTTFDSELITPTGALIVDQIVSAFGPAPQGTFSRSGTGWGHVDLTPTPNGLRAFLFAASPCPEQEGVESVMLLESNVDHLTGEEIGSVYGPLFSAGALDVIYLPGMMKKNRPGGLLQVLCRRQDLSQVQACFVDQTMTLGLRRREVERIILPRQKESRETKWGSIESKVVSWQDRKWSRPEFEALQELAQKTGRSVVQLRYLLQGLDGKGQEE